MSNDNFIKNFKIKKALDGYKASLNYGDKLHMFNCLYKVTKFDENGYTFLEDEKNSKFALPTDKLMLMMKKGVAKNYGAVTLFKAQISGPGQKVGVSPKALKQAASSQGGAGQGSGITGPRGEPVGTTKQGGDGQWYKKVSANPAQWVHVGKGTAHSTPGSEEVHPLSNPEDNKKFMQIKDLIHNHASPADHKKLEEKALAWATQMHKYKNMMSAHNAGDIDQSTGAKLPKQGIANSAMNAVYHEQDKAIALKKELIDAIKESRARKK